MIVRPNEEPPLAGAETQAEDGAERGKTTGLFPDDRTEEEHEETGLENQL